MKRYKTGRIPGGQGEGKTSMIGRWQKREGENPASR